MTKDLINQFMSIRAYTANAICYKVITKYDDEDSENTSLFFLR